MPPLTQAATPMPAKVKERIQKVVLPEGLVIDPKKRYYRTRNINKPLMITVRISMDCEGEITGR